MPRTSAGLLIYRHAPGGLQVLVVHPGGPFFRNRDEGAWSIPKGETEPGEEPLAAARREVREELGAELDGPFTALTPVRQKGGKIVHAWAVPADFEPTTEHCNAMRLEWPRGSRRFISFPEIDRAEFVDVREAERRLNVAQVAFLRELVSVLAAYDRR